MVETVSGQGQTSEYEQPNRRILLREKMTEFADAWNYKYIPEDLKIIVINEAVRALLLDRKSLLRVINRSEANASSKKTSVAGYDLRSKGSFVSRRRREFAKKKIKEMNKLEESKLLTQIDRSLIASHHASVKLANAPQFAGMMYPEIFQHPDFKAAIGLCVNGVHVVSKQLPYDQQWDPTKFQLSRRSKRPPRIVRPYVME